MLNEDLELQWPLRFTEFDTGEVSYFASRAELVTGLEDWDTRDPECCAEGRIEDALGRAVDLRVKIYSGVCEVSLRDPPSSGSPSSQT